MKVVVDYETNTKTRRSKYEMTWVRPHIYTKLVGCLHSIVSVSLASLARQLQSPEHQWDIQPKFVEKASLLQDVTVEVQCSENDKFSLTNTQYINNLTLRWFIVKSPSQSPLQVREIPTAHRLIIYTNSPDPLFFLFFFFSFFFFFFFLLFFCVQGKSLLSRKCTCAIGANKRLSLVNQPFSSLKGAENYWLTDSKGQLKRTLDTADLCFAS